LDHLIFGREFQRCNVSAVVVDSDSDRANPCIILVPRVGDKESIHLELAVADDVEDGALLSLKGIAE
jgi:hypothetical protein